MIKHWLHSDVSVQKFTNVFSKCCDNRICYYLFQCIIDNHACGKVTMEKYRQAICIIQKECNPTDDVYKESLRCREFLELLMTDNTAYIRDCSQRKDDVLLMAVSLNQNTPMDIIKYLITIKDIKNAKIIRTNAERLKKRVAKLF